MFMIRILERIYLMGESSSGKQLTELHKVAYVTEWL